MTSLATTLDTIRTHLPPALVTPDAFALARARLAPLPAEITSTLYFECRLAAAHDGVDVIVSIDRAAGAILAGGTVDATLPPRLRTHPVWERIQQFCRRWIDPREAVHDYVDHLWLEFDVSREGAATDDGVLPPGIFICFGEQRPREFTVARWHQQAIESLEALLGQLPVGLAARLDGCLRALPPTAYLPYVGMMFREERPVVRLCLAAISESELEEYLSAAGWTGGRIGPLAEMALSHPPPTVIPDRLAMVHVDVGESLLPRIGFERCFWRRRQVLGMLDDHALVDALTARGACTAAKRDGLAQWPGHAVARLPHQAHASVAVRRVNHLKLVADGATAGDPVEAKAYLFVSFVPHHNIRNAAVRGGVS